MERSLERHGAEVTAFAHNPAKLGQTHDRLRVVQGDLTDAARIEAAIPGADAVLASWGRATTSDLRDQPDGSILSAVPKTGVRRLVISVGPRAFRDPQDDPGLRQDDRRTAQSDGAQRLGGYDAGGGKGPRQRPGLTIVRVPMLTDDPAKGDIKIGYLGWRLSARIARADMATFILKQARDRTYLRQAPVNQQLKADVRDRQAADVSVWRGRGRIVTRKDPGDRHERQRGPRGDQRCWRSAQPCARRCSTLKDPGKVPGEDARKSALRLRQTGDVGTGARGIERMFLMRPPAIADVARYVNPVVDAAHTAGVQQIVFLSLLAVDPRTPHWQ